MRVGAFYSVVTLVPVSCLHKFPKVSDGIMRLWNVTSGANFLFSIEGCKKNGVVPKVFMGCARFTVGRAYIIYLRNRIEFFTTLH